MYYTSADQVIYDLNKLLIFLSVIDKFENGKNHPMVSQGRITNLLAAMHYFLKSKKKLHN